MLLQQVLLLDLHQSSILKQLASCQFCSPQVCSFIPRSCVFKHRHTGSGACNQFIILVGGAKSFLAPKRNLTGFWVFFMNVFIPFTLYKPELAVYDSSVFLKSKMEEKLERVENDCLSAYSEVSLASRKKGQDLRSCMWFEDRVRHVFDLRIKTEPKLVNILFFFF